jgi:glyoxylase-like metal-dependent hydrolase (beta-lactamase superfamily II)
VLTLGVNGMSHQEPIKIGRFSLFAVRDGNFRLDGGAMFGVIPKTAWAKEHPPDDRNRIEMAVRCLLIVDGDRRYLVDPGLDFFDEAGKDKYGVDHSTYALDRELARVGFTRADITDVILTHLHLDHCGYGKEHEHEQDRFPNATYYLQRSHLAWARAPNEKDALSFRIEDVERLERTRDLRLLDGDTWLAPGLQLFLCEGHTVGMQLVRVSDGGKSAVFVGDLIPSSLYLRLSWVSAYDLDPLQMVKDKKNMLAEATTQGTILFFGHDRDIAGCTVKESGGRAVVDEILAT